MARAPILGPDLLVVQASRPNSDPLWHRSSSIHYDLCPLHT